MSIESFPSDDETLENLEDTTKLETQPIAEQQSSGQAETKETIKPPLEPSHNTMRMEEKQDRISPEEQYHQDAIEVFNNSMLNILNEINEDQQIYKEPDKYLTNIGSRLDKLNDPKQYVPLVFSKSDVEVFVRHAYNQRKDIVRFRIEDFTRGAKNLNKREFSRDYSKDIYYPKTNEYKYYKHLKMAEYDVMHKIAMLNMTNEICRALGTKEITAEQFIDLIEQKELKDKTSLNFYSLYGIRYLQDMNKLQIYPEWIKELGLDTTQETKEREDRKKSKIIFNASLTQRVAEDLGKSVFNLTKEDIPYIIASFVHETERNFNAKENIVDRDVKSLIYPYSDTYLFEPLDVAIKHVLSNEHIETLIDIYKYSDRLTALEYKNHYRLIKDIPENA